MTTLFRNRHPFDTELDISSVAFWSRSFDERETVFRDLRRTAPVSWHPPLETPGLPARYREAGFWAVTRASDIAYVSRHHQLFSSEIGQVNLRPAPFSIQRNMLVLDPPDHSVYRRIVSAAFAARNAGQLERGIARHARQLVLRAARQEEFDFVSTIAAQLPLRTIGDLLDVPSSERDRFVVAADAYTTAAFPTAREEEMRAFFAAQSAYLQTLIGRLLAERRHRPGDDLLSRLVVSADETGELSDREILSTVLLLIVAGHDTTKQAITLSLLALDQHPDQRAWLLEDYEQRFDRAFDELMRYSSPVLAFARTATQDLVLGGRSIAAGDKVGLFYCSANRDEAAFDLPHELDLDRDPNRHAAFGGGGVHFCLGSAVARLELKAVFREILPRLPELRLLEPEYRFSDFVHAVESLPVQRGRRA